MPVSVNGVDVTNLVLQTSSGSVDRRAHHVRQLSADEPGAAPGAFEICRRCRSIPDLSTASSGERGHSRRLDVRRWRASTDRGGCKLQRAPAGMDAEGNPRARHRRHRSAPGVWTRRSVAGRRRDRDDRPHQQRPRASWTTTVGQRQDAHVDRLLHRPRSLVSGVAVRAHAAVTGGAVRSPWPDCRRAATTPLRWRQLPADGDDAWQDPAYLESLVPRASAFTLGEGQKQALDLKLRER